MAQTQKSKSPSASGRDAVPSVPIQPRFPKIVCLCGSSRFCDVGAVKAWEFEKQGIMAIGMHLLPAWYPNVQPDHMAEHENVAAVLDALHLKKIELSDSVFVLNVGGYIGERTHFEIKHALSLGKPVVYMEPLSFLPSLPSLPSVEKSNSGS